MRLRLAQIAGMIRYETLVQWRRRALMVIMLSALVLPLVEAPLAKGFLAEMNQTAAASGGVPAHVARWQITLGIVGITWAWAYLVLALLVPPVAADAIPRDRQIGVRELLMSLPLSNATYLTGKVLSVWVSVLIGLVVDMLVVGIVWWLLVGPYTLGPYVTMWLIGAGGVALLNSAVGLLLAAGLPTRRWAVLVGIAFSVVSIIMVTSWPQGGQVGSAWYIWNPGRPALFDYYMYERQRPLEMSPGGLGQVVPSQTVLLAIGAGAAQVALLWLMVWGWMRWREK